MNDKTPANQPFILYTTVNGDIKLNVYLQDETIWLTQKLMAELFGVDVRTISEHLKNIFAGDELIENSVVRKFRITATDGKPYLTQFYNLDAIISVGYRVNSREATMFRIWATQTLREYIIKGFVLDDERLKNGTHFGKDYFADLLEKIREIRASERLFYQKITDIYATSADYDPREPATREFFALVQNKLEWAITGQTGPEIIHTAADATKPNMGLTSWKNGPKGKILKSDVSTAKNYLAEKHIIELDRLVSAYLDLAENRAQRGIIMRMTDWAKFLTGFLDLNEYPNLQNKGKITRLQAKLKAEAEYEKFRPVQDRHFESDFDREMKRFRNDNPKSL